MDPMQYLESLIAGQECSTIPVQLSELKLLLMFMQAEKDKQGRQ